MAQGGDFIGGIFQSTLPARGATHRWRELRKTQSLFQSTLPARGATVKVLRVSALDLISIHAPREGSDSLMDMHHYHANYFNPRSPRGERLKRFCKKSLIFLFQSTLPARGATPVTKLCTRKVLISIHAPREGSDEQKNVLHGVPYISIHAPREGSDLDILTVSANPYEFQSTLPARGATIDAFFAVLGWHISIHAPREGSDLYDVGGLAFLVYFNPRSPRGERPYLSDDGKKELRFQSTLPARGAT